MSLYKPYTSQTISRPVVTVTEFDILKASHKFLRDDTKAESSTSWNDQLAKKYYDTLYREFAICDLKHYKSGNFALRWRTESEVLDVIGETTCANTRCEHHRSPSPPDLSTLELPFAYEEHGEQKEALVKIVLCPKCVRKLLWKRRQDKRDGKEKGGEGGQIAEERRETPGDDVEVERSARSDRPRTTEEEPAGGEAVIPRERRRRSSRSRSPRRRAGDGESSSRDDLGGMASSTSANNVRNVRRLAFS